MKMKIAFLSAPAFADCDVPLVAALRKHVDVTYILNVSEGSRQQSMLNMKDLARKNGIYPAKGIDGLEMVGRYVDLSNTYVNWHGQANRLSLFLSELKLLRFLKKGRYDIVHITNPYAIYSFPLYLLRKKMVMTVHDPLPHSSNVNPTRDFYRKVALRLLSNFIILNHTQREKFINVYGLQKKHIYESRLGIYYHLSDIEAVDPEERGYVLFFGQISSYKGLDILCEAMRKVRKEFPEVKLIVAGRGDIYFNIDQYVKEETIEFRNYYIPDEVLAGLIKNALFTVCPYIDATQSGVIMSSYSLNTPAVVSNAGGLPEMVGNGIYGPIVPAGDIDALAATIIRLSREPKKVEDYRNRIHEDYSSGKYSWDSIAQGMYNIYVNCVRCR